MFRFLFSCVLAFFAVSTSAQSTSVRIIPPNPDSRTSVVLRVGGLWNDNGHPRCATVVRPDPTNIIVNLGCVPENAVLPVLTPWSLDVPIGVLPAGEYDIDVRFLPAGPTAMPSSIQRHLIVQDGDAAFTVTPNTWSGPPPDRIVLKGEALRCNNAQLCAPAVRFGTIAATFISQTGDEIHVSLPTFPPIGTHDVTVTRGSDTLRRAEAFHVFDPKGVPSPEFFTPVLLPVMLFGSGALGSIWDTDASILNDNDYRFVNAFGTLFNAPCVLCDPPPAPGVPSKEGHIISASMLSLNRNGGYQLYVPRDAARNLHFGLLVRDQSRQAEALGTEIPVVREHDWRDGSIALLNVPADSRFRVALRVYSRAASTTAQLTVRSLESSEVLVTHPLVTTAVEGDGPDHGSVVIADLLGAYPSVAGRGPLRVEITQSRPDDLLWAFVAVTNNTTQHVTTISPQ